jgi:flagellar motility protein MotE (MotC chaperone)
MMFRFLPLFALLAFVSAPMVIGSAGDVEQDAGKKPVEVKEGKPDKAVAGLKGDEAAGAESKSDKAVAPAPVKKGSNECLASEEVVQDLEAREKKLQEREDALKEKEKEIAAQAAAVKDELSRLENRKAEIQGAKQKELARREEQVNKMIETLEGMSPKAAAQVIGGVEDELAVLALGRLTSAKAGKILANLKAEKSARLAEMMAYGGLARKKEGATGDSRERSPAAE